MLEILFVGTGDAFTKQYFNTNLIVSWNNTNLLIDCGGTCSRSLHLFNFDLKEIKNVFISHLHADHVSGVEELALKNKYVYKKKPSMYVSEKLLDSLWCTLKGGLEAADNGKQELDYYFNVFPVKDSFEIEGLKFQIYKSNHVVGMNTFSISFKNVYYFSDVVFDESNIKEISSKFDVLIHECSFLDNPVHTYYKNLLKLPKEIRKKIYLVHYNDNSEKMRNFMVREGFNSAETHQILKIKT